MNTEYENNEDFVNASYIHVRRTNFTFFSNARRILNTSISMFLFITFYSLNLAVYCEKLLSFFINKVCHSSGFSGNFGPISTYKKYLLQSITVAIYLQILLLQCIQNIMHREKSTHFQKLSRFIKRNQIIFYNNFYTF